MENENKPTFLDIESPYNAMMSGSIHDCIKWIRLTSNSDNMPFVPNLIESEINVRNNQITALKKDLELARAERDRAILEGRKEIEATVKDYRFKSAQITLNALNTYAKHRPNCRHNPHVRTECTEPCVCGLSEAFREIQDALGHLSSHLHLPIKGVGDER